MGVIQLVRKSWWELDLFSLQKRELQGNLRGTCPYLWGVNQDGARLFTVVYGRQKKDKVKQLRFRLSIKETFHDADSQARSRLTSKIMQSQFFQFSRAHWIKPSTIGLSLEETELWARGRTKDLLKSLPLWTILWSHDPMNNLPNTASIIGEGLISAK